MEYYRQLLTKSGQKVKYELKLSGDNDKGS